jgi:hypothetical protein
MICCNDVAAMKLCQKEPLEQALLASTEIQESSQLSLEIQLASVP